MAENEKLENEAHSHSKKRKEKPDELSGEKDHIKPYDLPDDGAFSDSKEAVVEDKESPAKALSPELPGETSDDMGETHKRPKETEVPDRPRTDYAGEKTQLDQGTETESAQGEETEVIGIKPAVTGAQTGKTKDARNEFLSRFSPLIFGKYDLSEVVVEDPGLRRYINLAPVGIPHTGARHANKWFGKTKINIVERLINNLMRTEHATGKKTYAFRIVKKSFEIIQKRTNKNPIQVFINALENSSPKEEITRLRFGGISVPKAVDTSSSHRLDVALRNICRGTISASHKNKKRMEVCLAEEIIMASKADMNSYAVSKKEEMERVAASAR